MERLTQWQDGHAYYPRCFEEPCYGGGCKDRDCLFETAICERLAADEDTGLMPEEIKSAVTPDAIIKLAAQALETTPDELRGMAKARKDGRLAILPTARGDMLTSEEVSAVQPFFDDVDVSVHYCTSNGMMIFVGYDAFRDWVKNWEIAAANKEAERALGRNGNEEV